MTQVYLALGSNLLDPLYQLTKAFSALNILPYTNKMNISTLYRTRPYGGIINQPDYLNAVIELQTTLQPEILLDYTQRIELESGRFRSTNRRWGPRTLDIDIILFGEQIINTSRLTIPHYDMHNRPFMLVPLFEIAPFISLPNGYSLTYLLNELDCSEVFPWLNLIN